MTSSSPANGHEARVVQWMTEHGPAVRGYIQGVVRRADLAEDLVQEVFRRVWQARERYCEQGSPRAYLLRIADRLICDHHRRTRREVTLDEAGWEDAEPLKEIEAGGALTDGENQMALRAALNMLSPMQRRVLLLRYYGEMSFEEIAATINCPLSTALSHCRRGLLALRKIMTGSST